MAGRMRNEVSSSSSNTRGKSVVVDRGTSRGSCIYCRSPGHTSISYGLLAQSLTVDDFQDLLDRGWRRSGCFLYKPDMERTCCPPYTIRLKASNFVPSKEQLRVSRRMQRFLDGTLDDKNVDVLEYPNTSKESKSSANHEYSSPTLEECLSASNGEQNDVEKTLHYLSDQIDNVVHTLTENGQLLSGIQVPKASVKKVSRGKIKSLINGSEDLLYSSSIAFQIAAFIRWAQLGDNDIHQSTTTKDCAKDNGSSPKAIAEKLATSLDQMVKNSGLSMRACNGHINFYSSRKQASSSGSVQNTAVPKKSSMKHGNGGNFFNSPQNFQVKRRRLEIRLKRSSFDPEEFALYRRYQLQVHNDKSDRGTEHYYHKYLVDTPLLYVPPTSDGTVPSCGLGSFHQQYVVDGQLVAVSVIDILPRCLSSRYFFWDPDFSFLSLGKYSVLQEIGWVKENQVHCPILQYYYLGYHVHSCLKMRYKAAYRPSELLCPPRYRWIPFDVAKPLLDRNPYAVLSDSSLVQNEESSLPQVTKDFMERHPDDDIGQEDANIVPMDEAKEMTESELESSDDDPGPEIASYGETEDGLIGKVVLGLNGSRFRYKDLPRDFDRRNYLESQLPRYTRAVGPELSERMAYSLG